MQNNRGFASDNNSGVHPDIMQSIVNVNKGHCIAYGGDYFTLEAQQVFKSIFGEQSETYFVFLGTGANVLSLKSVTDTFNSIICAETAHIQVDECGAPEKFTGCKLLPVKTKHGKITPENVSKYLFGFEFEHHSQPIVISITQATELGTVYTPHEIKALADLAHEYKMYLHVDGARIANAAATLNCTFKEMITDTGVDILSFGGTKNGMMYGEAIVFLKKGLDKNFKYYRKQAMQLTSKMRFISAQFSAYLKNDLWLSNASHSNKMAKLLESEISQIPQIIVTHPVQANGVFAIIPKDIIPELQKQFFFYVWDETTSEVRWMTSWDTEESDIYEFANCLKSLLKP